ncbi:MAG: hypothetical protein M3O31_16065 [Acidobacteriota bacterium]|nr:hypothetical protein [Acidobacteriota bacterium]
MTSNTLLLRQVHPTFVQDGRATSQAFVPTEKDANQLSVDDGDQVTPLVSWERYTVTFGYKSAGVLAVTPDECKGLSLPVVPDGVPYPDHCYIDFADLIKKEAKRKAKLLLSCADVHGWQLQKTQQA